MRYVSVDSLQAGMILARPLYRRSDVLLAKGVVLTEQYIRSIKRNGFPGIYIQDALSADIEVEPLISDTLRMETTRRLERIREMAKRDDDGTHTQDFPDITEQIEEIVSELYRNKDVMVNMLDLSTYDNYTFSHSLNVTLVAILLGVTMGLPRADLVGLGTGSLLHDIGKIKISKRILLKDGPLTDEEFEVIKRHPVDGFNYISTRFHLPAKHSATILDHHEKYDGTGYPNHKKGEDISIFGRICSVADVYDALSSRRPYREALPIHECVEYIMAGAFTQFDPEVVRAFTRRIAPYPVGTSVALSNNWVGLVLENYASYSLRPKLRIYQQNGEDVTPFEISLKDDPNYLNVTITGIT